ncbi:hypothetical protein KP509_1Z115800 [Ceratopteris richardii]|nr:hypothetical protein KP509_1Z115800 [Ceratopteris richardii]
MQNIQDIVNPDRSSYQLERFLAKLADDKVLHMELDSWLDAGLSTEKDGCCMFGEPFELEKISQFDNALGKSPFPGVMRMPSMCTSSPVSRAQACLAVEDFLRAAVETLWKTFWSDEHDFPFLVAGTQKLTGRLHVPCCAALVERCNKEEDDILLERIYEIVMLCDGDQDAPSGSFPSAFQVSQAVLSALQLLISRRLSKLRSFPIPSEVASTAFVLLVHSHGGSLIKLDGDISKLDTNNDKVYNSAAAWVQKHANLKVSAIKKVWTKFGNVNWHDAGALQMVLATFCSLEQRRPPKISIFELSTQHRLSILQRAEQRRMETKWNSAGFSELLDGKDFEESRLNLFLTFMKIESGTLLWLEDCSGKKALEIHDVLSNGKPFVYTAVDSDDEPRKLLNIYIGAHPAQLEPFWEDMETWYQVQRQTRILNVMEQRGLSSKYIPQVVYSGVLLCTSLCKQQTSKEHHAEHWCGVPVLVTVPVGEPLQRIFVREGAFSSMELIRCARDCLLALQLAHSVGIQHSDITPDHVMRVMEINGDNYYALEEWGHAVLEEKDRPGINLKFSSTDALQDGKLNPVSDAESLLYMLFYLHGGELPQFDSLESALEWRFRAWTQRAIQKVLGEASIVLKALADYVDSLCGTPYAIEYDIWVIRLNRILAREGTKHNGNSSHTCHQ